MEHNPAMINLAMTIKVVLLLLLAMAALTACKTLTADDSKILYVDHELVDCQGIIPQKCMKTRTDENADWLFFYDQIEGFEYVAGYRYKLRVKITELEDVPQDASSLHHKLIEVLEKIPVSASQ